MKKIIALSLTLLAAGAVAAHAADAKELWDKNCKKCHGEDGKGKTAMGKKLRGEGLHERQGPGGVEG